MTAFLQLSGLRVASGHVTIPYYRAWTADVMVVSPQPYAVDQKVTLTLGNLVMQGAVYRSGPFAGQQRVRIVGGAGGWRKTISEQQYQADAGVNLSMVLKDAASAVGETIDMQDDAIVGSHYVRRNDAAERVLRRFVDQRWWIDPATGKTMIRDARPTTPIGSPFSVVEWDGDTGVFEIATEDYKSWQPGATFQNVTVPAVQTIGLTTIDAENDGQLRFKVMSTQPTADRLIDEMRAVIRDQINGYTGTYEYAVQSTDGETADLQPTAASGLPTLRKVELRVGMLGRVKPRAGQLAHVIFLDGDPTKPEIQGYAADLGSPAAARVGDKVNAGYLVFKADGTIAPLPYYPGTPLGLVAANNYASSVLSPPGTVVALDDGRITSGSSVVGIT